MTFLKKVHNLWSMKFAKPATGCLIVAFFVAFGSIGSFSKSVGNQEFFSYHIGDIVRNLTGSSSANLLASGHDFIYEDHLYGDLYGVAEGRNLIVVQVESFQDFLLNREYNGEEITPNLNALIQDDTIYFDNYFMQVAMGNTSDAEFATNNSLYGTIEYCTYTRYESNHYRGLPVLLAEKGYDVAAFHGYRKDFWNREGAYPNLGFNKFYGEEDFDFEEVLGFGIRDDEFFEQSLDYMEEMTQPFYSFMVTLSHHHPFIVPADADKIEPLPEDEGTMLHDYIVSARFTDRCIGEFIEELKARDLYDNSVIVFYGDHFGLTAGDEEIAKSVSNFLGKEYKKDEMAHIPLIIHIPGEDVNQTVSISGGQLDFLPTIAYLMGFEKLDTLYLGRNLLLADSGFVIEYTYFPKGSFIRDDVIYIMGSDGVFENGEAWNMKTGEPVDLSQCREGSERSIALINLSEYYLKNDQIGKLLGESPRAPSAKVEIQEDEEEELDVPEELDMLLPGAVKPGGTAGTTNTRPNTGNSSNNNSNNAGNTGDEDVSDEETPSEDGDEDPGDGGVGSNGDGDENDPKDTGQDGDSGSGEPDSDGQPGSGSENGSAEKLEGSGDAELGGNSEGSSSSQESQGDSGLMEDE